MSVVLMAYSMKIMGCWDVMSHSLINTYQHFTGTCAPIFRVDCKNSSPPNCLYIIYLPSWGHISPTQRTWQQPNCAINVQCSKQNNISPICSPSIRIKTHSLGLEVSDKPPTVSTYKIFLNLDFFHHQMHCH